MTCASCGHDNRAGRRFCVECGAALALACPGCGTPCETGEKFCGACGADLRDVGKPPSPVPPPPLVATPPSSARQVVTIVFADLAGSTALHERLDPESVRRFMEGFYQAVRGAIAAHGGTLVKLLGDGVMAAFGIPRVAEDDALRAVHGAVAIQTAFAALAGEQLAALGELGLRVAVNTGEVVVSADDTDVVGDPVNVAARLQQEAGLGEVVIGEATQRLVAAQVTLASLGRFALKGRAGSVTAWRVASLARPASAAAAAFVGREAELARLTAVYDAAVATPAARLAVLLGSPGLGKSRLIDEFARRHGETATLLTAHCDAAGGATFAPLAAALRARLGLEDAAGPETLRAAVEDVLASEDADRARIAGGIAALLAGSPASPEETFFVIRRFLARFAAAQPVVLVIDDLHWAEPLLLDLVEHLVQWGAGVPLLVLVGARPELRDLRSTLATPGGLVADVVTLAGLDAGAAMRLAANVIGAADLPAAVAVKVLATSEGNPLFVGELVRMLVQEGALTREGDRWIVGDGLAALEMPPTIHALLAARIERLRPEERQVLERAAVVGRHFSRNAVAALLQGGAADLDARLESLRRGELIERDSGWLLGEPVLRFHHVLIRDAAYRRLLKGTRAELHGRLADWIEAQVGDAAEHDETIGWHLEQAHQLLGELAPLDATGTALGARAAARLAAAGRRALAADDVPLAASLLGRAIERLERDDPGRAELALDWCEALLAAGDVAAATTAIAELARHAAAENLIALTLPQPLPHASRRLAAWHACFAGQLTVLTAPAALQATADALAAAAAALTALGDAAGEAKAHSVHAQALARLGRVGACEAALDRALAAARKAGDRRRANAVLAGAPLAALWGPSPVTRASGRCLDVVRVLRITQGAPAVEAVALSCQGVLEALRGRTDAARRMLAAARQMVEELGIAHRLHETDAFAGRIAAMEGDAAAAEALLRSAYDGLRELGLGIDAARAGALLARVLLAQDRAAEAEALSHESEALAGDDLQAAIAWRGVRAEALARRGEHAAAIELAQAAVAIAAATDALLDHADARLALAAALRAAGRGAEADAAERHAIELWEAKGASLLAERARSEQPAPAGTWDGQAREGEAPAVPPRPATGSAGASPSRDSVAGSSPPQTRRRVRPNGATQGASRFDAAFAAADPRRLDAHFGDSPALVVIDHPTESTYGSDGAVESYRRLRRMQDPVVRHEPLATLGESLGLFRRHIAARGGGGRFDVGTFEREEIVLLAPDVIEIFAADHLDQAVAALYARYAELLPDGPERRRAATAARGVATFAGQADPERIVSELAPAFVCVDHRSLHLWDARSPAEFVTHFRLQDELATRFVRRIDDVIALAADRYLLRLTYSGTARDGDGGFENVFLALTSLDADGLITRIELWDPDREAEALARVHALAGALDARPAPRRVGANDATQGMARMEAALAARDGSLLADVFDDALHVVHHPTRATYGRREMLGVWRSVLQAERFDFRSELLASLGGALALERHVLCLEGLAEAHLQGFGRSEFDEVVVLETDDRGRWLRCEIFAADRLGAAIARLYARYAELLPDGPARTRAAGVARSVTAWNGPIDLEYLATVYAPSVRIVDHRFLRTWSARDADEILGHFRHQLDLAPDFAARYEDVLAVAADALVARVTFFGTVRDSGGAFENKLCACVTFGADGRIAFTEVYEAEQEAEALVRFDAIVAGAPPPTPAGRRRLRPNAASAMVARMEAAFAARDLDAVDALLGASMESVDHTNGITHGREGHLDSSRRMMRLPGLVVRLEAVATLGERVCLLRRLVSASGTGGGNFDVAEYEMEHVGVLELDADGRCRSFDTFAADRLGAALVRLYERYAESLPEGPERRRAAAAAGSIQGLYLGLVDRERLANPFSPEVVWRDQRIAGVGTLHGDAAVLAAVDAFLALVRDARWRFDDVLACCADAILVRATNLGTDRAGGGAFERQIHSLCVFDADGRIARWESFDAEREAAALARFDEFAAVPNQGFANDATRFVERYPRTWAGRDWHALADLYAPNCHFDDRRPLLRMELAREANLEQLRVLFEVPNSRWTMAAIATRGERLALIRLFFEGEAAAGGGALEIDHLGVCETDGAGRLAAVVLFEPDDEAAAWAELDRRYENGEGDTAGWCALRAVHGAVERRDWDASTAAFAAGFAVTDRRRLGWGLTLDSAEMFTRSQRSLAELAPDVRYRFDHVRASDRGYLTQLAQVGTRDGGSFESPFVYVATLDAAGRPERFDLWDLDGAGEAVECYRALVPPPASDGARPSSGAAFANAASATAESVVRCLIAHEWEGFRALLAEGFHMSDRRRVVQLELDREQYVAFTREVADGRTVRNGWELVATRGDCLALTRACYEFADADVGPSEIAFLLLQEVDGRGRVVAYVRWDVDDLDAAYAELDARWQAGATAAPSPGAQFVADYQRCFAARDWTAFAACLTPELIARSHRLTGWGTVHGPAALVDTLRVQIDLAPNTRMRMDHVRAGARGALFAYAWLGTYEGGEFENDYLVVAAVDAAGRQHRVDVFEAEELDQAQACFTEIERDGAAAPAPPGSFANAATATVVPVSAALAAHDWPCFARLLAEHFHCSDRRRVVQLEMDRDQHVAFVRAMADGRTVRADSQVLATRGARLALLRATFEFADADVGPSEIAYLVLIEVDGGGRTVAYVRWDVDELDAAFAELNARWLAGEGAADRAAAWTERLAAIRDQPDPGSAGEPLFAPQFVAHDHRLVGWGTLHGGRALLDTLRILSEMAPDVRPRIDHVRTCAHGIVTAGAWVGTHGGGAFESGWLSVVELDADGRAVQLDLWDPNHLAAALARFAALPRWTALASGARSEASAALARPNAASAAMDRWQAAFAAGDWAAVRALGAPQLRIEDRRGHAQIAYDADTAIADWRVAHAAGARPQRRLLGTAGERIAVEHLLWSGGPPDGRWEIEFLWLLQVGDDGRFTAAIAFDADDARAAQREAWARWAGLDPTVTQMTTGLGEAIDAWNAEDVGRLRACFADDLVVEDHRRTGTGRSEGREAYLRSVQALWRLAPGSRFEAGWHWLAITAQAGVYAARRFGALPDGGAFESEFLGVGVVDRGLTTRIELFEIDAVDAALARFRALTRHPLPATHPDLLRIPPNAAAAVGERHLALIAEGDWHAVRALHAPSLVFDDRRPGLRTTTDGDAYLAGLRWAHAGQDLQVTRTLLATAGERLALHHNRFTRAGEIFEIDTLNIQEIDADGRLLAVVLFAPEDRAAASTELFERYAALGADGAALVALELVRAWNAHDLERLRALLPDDFYLDDRRRTGVGRLDGADAYLGSVAAMWELSRDLRTDALYVVADAPHGRLYVARWSGTNAEGGEFDAVYVCLGLGRGDRPVGLEIFELDDLDAARARFEALRPDPLRIPPNAGTS